MIRNRRKKKKKAFNLSRYITIAPHPYEYVWDNNIEYNVVDPLLNNHKQNSWWSFTCIVLYLSLGKKVRYDKMNECMYIQYINCYKIESDDWI